MGLRQTLTEWIRIAKDTLDFGPEFPAALEARHVEIAERLAKLQSLLAQAEKAAQEKDELIARLQAAGGVAGNLVLDGPVCFVRKENTLEGPYCTLCFQRNRETSRLAPAPQPEGADGPATDWIQCTKCRAPFRSERIGQYLNPGPAVSEPVATVSEGPGEAPPAKARSPRASTRRRKTQPPESMETFGDPT
jgi:hypothetical protein